MNTVKWLSRLRRRGHKVHRVTTITRTVTRETGTRPEEIVAEPAIVEEQRVVEEDVMPEPERTHPLAWIAAGFVGAVFLLGTARLVSRIHEVMR